jgi:hypothetical protein
LTSWKTICFSRTTVLNRVCRYRIGGKTQHILHLTSTWIRVVNHSITSARPQSI